MLGNSTSTVLTVLSHDDHRARQRHKHSQPRKARAGALMAHHPAWVGHHTGGSRSIQTVPHYPLHNFFNMVGERQCWLLSTSACGCATSENKPTFETHCEANENLPSISAEMLTIAVCTHADRAERASMVSVRTVAIMILDAREGRRPR